MALEDAPGDRTVDELEDELRSVEDAEALDAALAAEKEGKNRKTAKEAIRARMRDLDVEPADADDDTEGAYEDPEEAGADADGEEDVPGTDADEEPGDDESGEEEPGEDTDAGAAEDEADEEDAEGEAEDAEEGDGLSHPTRDKRHVRALTDGDYRDMWVYCETQRGELIDVSREMLGKARELMDEYNEEYGEDERVVAVLVGDDVSEHAEECVACGADLVVHHEDERLDRFRHKPYTELFCAMATAGSDRYEDSADVDWKDYDKPRYVLFPATNNGRDLSAQVQAELDSGLASDCSGLYITEEEISNPVKTGEPGVKKTFERVLHMKRPDFSGFEYSTILCLDNPDREFHPQGASVIPGSFEVPDPDPEREGEVVAFDADVDEDWLRVEVTDYDDLESGIDLTGHDVIVAVGRGIGDDPTRGMELGLELRDAFEDAELGISRGIVTSSYEFEGHVEQYAREERQIGETGQVVEPQLYVAAGISGAVQHKVGMDESDTIVAVNTDPDADIRNFSDYFVEGDLFEVLPALTEALESGSIDVEALAEGQDD